MALADVLTLYRAKLAAGAFVGGLELSTDHRDDLDSIPAGGLRFQIRADHVGEVVRSNSTREAWALEVTIARKLGAGEAERTYTEGATTGMVAQMLALIAEAFWLVAGVFELDAGTERVLEPSERVGKVVRFTVKATIIIAS